MNPYENYNDLAIQRGRVNEIKRRYSVTADVLSFRRCPRLYASLAERGFSPAQPSQRYVGSLVHQVLDRAHLHYSGRLDPGTTGLIPTADDIELFFNEVETALKAHGIRPFNLELASYVLRVLKRFNEIEGPTLYPRVKDTEHRLQSDRGNYILYGVVDVLVSGDTPNPANETVEIWDYKGSKLPDPGTNFGTRMLEDYTFQMHVYSSLFYLRNGYYPIKGIIYFLGELGEKNVMSRPTSAVLEVPLDNAKMENAQREFDGTVSNIVSSRDTNSWPPPSDGHETAGRETCDACDIRTSCPVEHYTPRLPSER
ncbi:MAG: PD-(D/E)XK nuclease family protein [Thermoplasmatales archaeon]|nr:PD-(D/E)XK nuclease family protein [Thermoplasmatales archaeon]